MISKKLKKEEEKLMKFLWKIDNGFLKDIVEKFPEPRPAYTTVSTVIRVLVKKGFIGFKTYGKTNEYFAVISKDEYFQRQVKPMLSNYFKGSPATMASYFSSAKLNISELEEMR